MNLSKTTSYALKILSFMAIKNEKTYSSEYLYEQLHIPHKYLRRLLTELTKHEFITSSRGRSGGFIFAKEISEITLYEIIDKVEGYNKMNTCLLGMTSCILNENQCILHDKWCDAREKVMHILKTTTLNDLKKETKTRVMNSNS
jgi:Rrf2 family protein